MSIHARRLAGGKVVYDVRLRTPDGRQYKRSFATKRDAYYQSKNWDKCGFEEQTESDAVMDDIEAMFSQHGVSREQLRYIPDEHGGESRGQVSVRPEGSGLLPDAGAHLQRD